MFRSLFSRLIEMHIRLCRVWQSGRGDLSINAVNDIIYGAGVCEGGCSVSEFRVAGVDGGVEEGGEGEGGIS